MSVQLARASWQLILIALITVGVLLGAKALPANLVANVVLGLVMVASIGLSIHALRQMEDDEDNAPRLKSNALYGFLAVAVLLGVTIWHNVSAMNARYAAELAKKFATPTPAATEGTPAPIASASRTESVAAATPVATPISAEEVRSFARSYLALVKRGLFDEAYRYLPADLQGRVSAKQHAAHWSAAAPADKLEEIDLVAAAAEEVPLAPGKSAEFKVQIPDAAPRTLLVTSSSGRMSAAPVELAKK